MMQVTRSSASTVCIKVPTLVAQLEGRVGQNERCSLCSLCELHLRRTQDGRQGLGVEACFLTRPATEKIGKKCSLGKSSTLEIMVALFTACAARKAPNSLPQLC